MAPDQYKANEHGSSPHGDSSGALLAALCAVGSEELWWWVGYDKGLAENQDLKAAAQWINTLPGKLAYQVPVP